MFPAVTFCNLNNILKSKVFLGGVALEKALQEIDEAQHIAVTGKSAQSSEMMTNSSDVAVNEASAGSAQNSDDTPSHSSDDRVKRYGKLLIPLLSELPCSIHFLLK